MQVIEEVSITTTSDRWLSLKALSQLSDLSVRSLRAYLTDPIHPLPHYRMNEAHVIKRKPRKSGQFRKNGKPRKDSQEPTNVTITGKIRVRWSDFCAWMERFRYQPDVDRIVEEVVAEMGVNPRIPS